MALSEGRRWRDGSLPGLELVAMGEPLKGPRKDANDIEGGPVDGGGDEDEGAAGDMPGSGGGGGTPPEGEQPAGRPCLVDDNAADGCENPDVSGVAEDPEGEDRIAPTEFDPDDEAAALATLGGSLPLEVDPEAGASWRERFVGLDDDDLTAALPLRRSNRFAYAPSTSGSVLEAWDGNNDAQVHKINLSKGGPRVRQCRTALDR